MTSTGPSPRRRWLAWVLLVVLIAIGVVEWTQPRWQSLPGVGEVRVNRIEYGRQIDCSGHGLRFDTLRKWLGPAWGTLMFGKAPGRSRYAPDKPAMFIVFDLRNTQSAISPGRAKCQIDLPCGQTLQGFCFYYGKESVGWVFRLAPRNERRLKIRLTVDQQEVSFEAANPAFMDHPPVWKAEPLPQTHTSGRFEITLQKIETRVSDRPSSYSPWSPEAKFSFRFDGQEERSMSWSTTYSDPLGNDGGWALYSEPVWKVHCSCARKASSPPTDSEIHWLGTTRLPKAGEAIAIKPTPAMEALHVTSLALIGSGRCQATPGEVTFLSQPTGEPLRRSYRSNPKPPHNIEANPEFDVNGIDVLVMCPVESPKIVPEVILRDASGKRISLGEVTALDERMRQDWSLSSLQSDLPPGEVEIGLGEIYQAETDFYVPVPPTPSPSDGKDSAHPSISVRPRGLFR